MSSRFAGSAGLVAASQIAGVWVALATSAATARFLAAGPLGRWYVLASVLAVLVPVGTFGLPTVMLRNVAAGGGAATTLRLAVVFATVAGAASAAVAKVVLQLPVPTAALVGWWVAALCVRSALLQLLRAQERWVAFVFAGGFGAGLVSLAALLVVQPPSVDAAVAVSASVTSLFVLANMVLLRAGVWRGGFDRQAARAAVRAGAALTGAMGAAMLTHQMPTWAAAAAWDDAQVALFGVAAKTAGLLTVPIVVVNVVFAPTMARLWSDGDRDGLARLLQRAATGTTALTAAGCVLLAVAGERVVALLFGGQYAAAAVPVVGLFACGHLVAVACGSTGTVLRMAGMDRQVLATDVLGAAVAAVAVWVAAPHGPAPLAGAAAFSMVVWQVAMLVVVRRSCGLWPAVSWRPWAS